MAKDIKVLETANSVCIYSTVPIVNQWCRHQWAGQGDGYMLTSGKIVSYMELACSVIEPENYITLWVGNWYVLGNQMCKNQTFQSTDLRKLKKILGGVTQDPSTSFFIDILLICYTNTNFPYCPLQCCKHTINKYLTGMHATILLHLL